jgi:homoserine kinase type II
MLLAALELDRKALSDVAEEYGLGRLIDGSGAIEQRGFRRYRLVTGKTTYNMDVYLVDDEVDLRREMDVMAFLEKHSFASPRLVVQRSGRPFAERGDYLLVVTRHPQAEFCDEAGLTEKRIYRSGCAIGEFHTLCRSYKKGADSRMGFDQVFETYAEVRRRIPPYFKKIVRTLDEETEYLGNYLETKLPKGFIHGGLALDCISFKGESVACISDFWDASRGKYVFDLATAVNAMCFVDGSYSLDRFTALMAGYESLRTLSLAEWDSFPNEMRFAALKFGVVSLHRFFDAGREEGERINNDFRRYIERLRVLRREVDGGMESLLMAMATGYDYRKYQRVKGEGGEDG